MDKLRFIALTGLALLAFGCRVSDHTLHVKDQEIAIGPPRQLLPNTIPFAISRDGAKVAIFDGIVDTEALDHLDEGSITLRVIDSRTFTPIGQSLSYDDLRGIAFDASGTHLYIPWKGKYASWDYITGAIEPLSDEIPEIAPINPWDSFANLDHSILYVRPGASSFTQKRDPNATEGSDGCVLAGSRYYTVPFTNTLGFDPYGDFWYKVGGKWTKVARNGQKVSPSAGPKSLVTDQTKSNGTLHLVVTRMDMKYKDATSMVSSIWLTDDLPTRDPVIPQGHYKAGLVFTGSDIFEYGFVPHQRMVYVVTGTGSYFIPYEFRSDAERAKKRREMRERANPPKVPSLR